MAYDADARTSAIDVRQGDRDGALFSLLSDSDVSYMLIPFDMFESAQAAHVKCIQSIVITDVQVPRLRSNHCKCIMLDGYWRRK